ncbi:hypothetical protein K435DRAFT_803320 [Dendrothele bispora CBS 962.96]|uniref:Uncharacterized protein n=1 Tax=Dendrothele bispora (strain CBS 962.96) TaxID=1314807 RepID=A0A4S8LIA1_DENBC|nr:hypothetical protein K435DRAFT_803320 [Dendrothele bispora CBS 962.96]
MHRTKLWTTAMSFLVAYTSLASTAPNHEKGKVLRVTAYTHKIDENTKKESMKQSLRYRIHLNGPNELKGNHCKYILQRQRTSKIKKSPRQILKIEKGTRKKFRLVHRMREGEIKNTTAQRGKALHITSTRVVTLSRVGKVFINISGYEYLYAFVV